MLYIVGFVVFGIIYTRWFGYKKVWSYIWRLFVFSFIGIFVWITFGCAVGWLFPQDKIIGYTEAISQIDNSDNYFMISSNNHSRAIYHYCAEENGRLQIKEVETDIDRHITIVNGSGKAELVSYVYKFSNEDKWQYLIAMPRSHVEYEFRLP
ncbi:hypothetical protein [Eubacterium ramulus]|uniref:hypothetical protein n=1 Tax=Eubacterium ramulus TaxID=39490 RepID=UPI00399AF567